MLLLALASAVAVWREPRYRALLPLQAAVVLMILVAGKWFDWRGGATWGYRPIVDAAPFLALSLIPKCVAKTARKSGTPLAGSVRPISIASSIAAS